MEAVSQATVPTENEEFWRHHDRLYKASGLTRIDYCRKNNLNYARFGYWLGKWSPQSSELVAVKLKAANAPETQMTLCTLNFSNGHCLKIHDLNALSIILKQIN